MIKKNLLVVLEAETYNTIELNKDVFISMKT